MRTFFKASLVSAGIAAIVLAGPAVRAGAHTWDVWEVFSNADGTVQFVELREANGTDFETGIGGHPILASPSGLSFTIPANVVAPTANRSYLIATPAFAALPGAPAPNAIENSGFLFALTDTSVTYSPYDTATWLEGFLPTNGINSLQRPGPGQPLQGAVNSPTNYAGATGSVNAGPQLPGVPDLTVDKLAADGSSLLVSFDTATCSDGNDHQILYGDRSGLPAALGGTFTLLGGACDIGSTSPYTWTGTPSAGDDSGLVWFLVVAEDDGGREGLWGRQTGGTERAGPGTNGASNVCAVTDKDLGSACGN
jgi:hypothetical protein